MGHFSMEIDAPTGSNLSGNQHLDELAVAIDMLGE